MLDFNQESEPARQVTRLQEKCKDCGKVARVKSEYLFPNPDPDKHDLKIIHLECGHSLFIDLKKGTPFQTLLSDDGKSPYPFQVEGMKFIETALQVNKGAAIFDEMGLGKTIQALGYLKFHPEAFPVLFVLKSGIKFQWAKEILRWLGDMYAPQVIEKSGDFIIPNLKCYIISYDLLVPKVRTIRGKEVRQGFDVQKLLDAGIKTTILDECQQIKNTDATRTQMVRKLAKVTNVIALSGTPWKNRGSEFYSVLNMLAPMKFPTQQGFLTRWVDFYYKGNRLKQGGINNPARFKEYIKDIAIRREVFEVLPELPSTNRTLHYAELDQFDQVAYDESVSEFVEWYNEKVIGGEEEGITGINILAKMARMRHIVGLAKIAATEAFVEDFLEETDRKLVIFVHHQDVGSILLDRLKNKYGKEIKILSLTSGHTSLERFQIQEDFNGPDRALLIASTLASGEGINLQTCADAIMHERQWNPANENQAAPGRFRRIGQEAKQVNVTFMTGSGTIDEYLATLVEEKRGYFHSAMNKGESTETWNENDIGKQLAESIANDWNKRNKKEQVNSLKKWMTL